MVQKKVNYKTLSAELDDILANLQDSETDIDEALDLYKRGQKITIELERYLKAADNTVKKLTPKASK